MPSAAQLYGSLPARQRRIATKLHGVLMKLQPRYEVGRAWDGVGYKLDSNYYLGWIREAKRPETRARRLEQMLDELARGDRYMKMPYRVR